MTIDLPIYGGFSNFDYEHTIQAEIVDVAPHITVATFAVHRYPYSKYRLWTVSNIETGCGASNGQWGTRREAIKEARRILAKFNDATMLERFARLPDACRT